VPHGHYFGLAAARLQAGSSKSRASPASRLKSLYRAVFVTNVDTGDAKQVNDGLARRPPGASQKQEARSAP
jgi:hypothetical protein